MVHLHVFQGRTSILVEMYISNLDTLIIQLAQTEREPQNVFKLSVFDPQSFVIFEREKSLILAKESLFMNILANDHHQGCGIAMPDSPDSYIEPAGQVDFPG